MSEGNVHHRWSEWLADRPPLFFFILSAIYLILLLALVPFHQSFPTNVGPIPLAVPWYGALGATVISLYGVFRYNAVWRPEYNLWHIARPLTGAILGWIAYLIFVSVIFATGSQPKTSGTLVYYVVAFLTGFREETFRVLVQRVVDILFTQNADQGEATGPRTTVDARYLPVLPPEAGRAKEAAQVEYGTGTDLQRALIDTQERLVQVQGRLIDELSQRERGSEPSREQ